MTDRWRLLRALTCWVPGYLLTLALSACTPAVKPAVPQVIVTGCTSLPRLQASRQDTLDTREAISAYIDKWDALCAPPATTGAKP